MMGNEALTQWILGVGFGIVVGWQFTYIYYKDKIRKLKAESLERELKNETKHLNTLISIRNWGNKK